jgi:hypothetical protein
MVINLFCNQLTQLSAHFSEILSTEKNMGLYVYHTVLRRNVSVALILTFRYSSLMALYIKSQKSLSFFLYWDWNSDSQPNRQLFWSEFWKTSFGALKSDSTHHFFRNACTKSGSLRFSQFSGCWLILSVYILTALRILGGAHAPHAPL